MFSLTLPSPFRANDGCLYVFDLEQNKRTLKVSMSDCVLLLGLLTPVSESCPPLVPHPAIKVSQTLADVKVLESSSTLQRDGGRLNPPPSSYNPLLRKSVAGLYHLPHHCLMLFFILSHYLCVGVSVFISDLVPFGHTFP